MSFITKKDENEYNDKLLELIEMISITKKYNIVGSFSFHGVYWSSDVDLNESIKIKNEKQINTFNKKLSSILLKLSENENIFFIVFKYGIDDENESLHWTYDEIIKGHKVYGNNKMKKFNDAAMDGTIKLDIIFRMNYSQFVEISIIYQINPEKIDIIHNLKADINEYLHIDRSYKALKRCFSFYALKNQKSKMYILLKLFNSDIGIISKIINEITIYIILLEMYSNKISLEEIKFGLQSLKYYINSIFRIKISNKFYQNLDKICNLKKVSKVIEELNKLNDNFKQILEDQTRTWITYNKNIIPK